MAFDLGILVHQRTLMCDVITFIYAFQHENFLFISDNPPQNKTLELEISLMNEQWNCIKIYRTIV